MSPEQPGERTPPPDDALREVFGFFEKNFPAGEFGALDTAELRMRMQQFADGHLPGEEIEALCEQILSSPEMIRTFVEILGGRPGAG